MATEHAPQSPSAQPSLVPVNPQARKNSSNVVFGEMFPILTGLSFNLNSNEQLINFFRKLVSQ